MTETPVSMTSKRRAARQRKSNFPTPPRDVEQRQPSIMHPAHLPHAGGSAGAFLNAGHAERAGQPFELAAERWTGRASTGTEFSRIASDHRPGEV